MKMSEGQQDINHTLTPCKIHPAALLPYSVTFIALRTFLMSSMPARAVPARRAADTFCTVSLCLYDIGNCCSYRYQ